MSSANVTHGAVEDSSNTNDPAEKVITSSSCHTLKKFSLDLIFRDSNLS